MNKVTENRVIDGVKGIGGSFMGMVKGDISDEDASCRFSGGVKDIYMAGRDAGFNLGYKIAGAALIASGFILDFLDKKAYEKKNK